MDSYLNKPIEQMNVKTLVFFHGNAGNIGHRYEKMKYSSNQIISLFI